MIMTTMMTVLGKGDKMKILLDLVTYEVSGDFLVKLNDFMNNYEGHIDTFYFDLEDNVLVLRPESV